MPKPALLVQFISIHITCFQFVWVPYNIPKDSIHKSRKILSLTNSQKTFTDILPGISPWRLLSSFSLKVTASLHLKMDGWNTIVSFLGQKAYFQVQTVSFRDGHQPTSRGVYIYIHTHYKDSLFKVGWPSPIFGSLDLRILRSTNPRLSKASGFASDRRSNREFASWCCN